MSKKIVTAVAMSVLLGEVGLRGLGRALGRIHDDTNDTTRDGVGFSSHDSGTGAYIVGWLRRNPQKVLSGKFISQAQKLCQKYRQQLANLYNANPSLFLEDFGMNLEFAMNIPAVRAVTEAKPKKRILMVAVVDDDGEIETSYRFEGDPAVELLAHITKYDTQLKTFVAGKFAEKHAATG